MKIMTITTFGRLGNLLRQYFDIFDTAIVGKSEQEWLLNSKCFRSYVKNMIDKRREELKNPN